jgi:hypothetical protein
VRTGGERSGGKESGKERKEETLCGRGGGRTEYIVRREETQVDSWRQLSELWWFNR